MREPLHSIYELSVNAATLESTIGIEIHLQKSANAFIFFLMLCINIMCDCEYIFFEKISILFPNIKQLPLDCILLIFSFYADFRCCECYFADFEN